MSGPSGDEMAVGIVALATVPWIGFILRRALRQGWLPVGKSRLPRDARPGAFWTLFVLYVAAAGAMAFVGLDLLFGIRGR